MYSLALKLSTTMNSSHFHTHGWTSDAALHAGFSDVHQHLDDNSHIFDEMMHCPQPLVESRTTCFPQPKAKVLFQFFDGWPMADS